VQARDAQAARADGMLKVIAGSEIERGAIPAWLDAGSGSRHFFVNISFCFYYNLHTISIIDLI
jgi:hypothetical protein